MKNIHALLVGVAVAILTALAGWLGHFSPATITDNPFLLIIVSAAVGVASRFIGSLLGKLGAPPPQTLVEAQRVVAQHESNLRR